MPLNLIKLCVGCDGIDDLIQWQHQNRHHWTPGTAEHVTRMWPKREAEILDGGSLYWVIKGVVQARQRILGLEERIGSDGIRRCALVLDLEVIRTSAATRRPFQGWRYLDPAESPHDLPKGRALDDTLPPAMALALAEIGLR
ncbi:MAG: DUF1489 family protein [Cypionkella sp.]